jgi:putative membrane protein
MYGLYNNYGGWGVGNMMGWFGGGIMMFLFWVLIIIFIAWIVREVRGKNLKSGGSALETLKERYVKGEINKEQFEIMKKDIS